MSTTNTNHGIEEDEISLRDIILVVKDYIQEVKQYWWILLIFILLLCSYNLYKWYKTETIYNAELTFTLNDGDSGSGGVSSLLGNFGLGGMTGGGGNLLLIGELVRSRLIIRDVLFHKVKVKNRNDYLANYLIDAYELQEKWRENSNNEKLWDYHFANDNIESFELYEKSIFKQLFNLIVNNKRGILKIELDEFSKVIKINAKSKSSMLAYEIANQTFNALSKYYIRKTIEKQEYTYKISKHRLDSLSQLLLEAEYALAKFKESHRNLQLETHYLKQQRLDRTVTRLSIIQSEAARNVEVSKFALNEATPFVQIIDRPLYPLRATSASLVDAIIFGVAVGLFLGIVFLCLRKLYRDIMSD